MHNYVKHDQMHELRCVYVIHAQVLLFMLRAQMCGLRHPCININ